MGHMKSSIDSRERVEEASGDRPAACEKTIVIPARNEAHRIESTLEEYLAYFRDDTEIIVVLNGCRDETGGIVSFFAESYENLRFIDEPGVVGKGGAVKMGFGRASGRIVAYVDADGATSARELERLMGEIAGYDGVIGSRWVDKTLVRKQQTLFRRLASRVFNLIVRVLFGLPYRDTQCGAKIFTSEVVNTVVDELGTTNLAFDVDLLYLINKKGFSIREVPTEWKDKPGSTIRMRSAAPTMFGALIRMRIKHSRFQNLVR